MRRDWPVEQAIVDLPIRLEGNSKRISGNSLNLLWAQNKDIDAASQTLLTAVKVVCYTAVFRVVTQRSSPLVGRNVA